MLSRKLLAVLMVGVFALAGCSAPATDDEVAVEEEAGPIKIGFISALTGGAASLGQMEKTIVEDFLERYPEWDGREVEVIFEDGQCNGQPAANAAQKLINVDNVELILGGLCSGETLAAAPIVNEAEVVLFSSTSTSPDVSDAGDFVFRNAPSDSDSSVVMAAAIAENYSKVAIINELTDFGVAYAQSLRAELESLDVEVVVEEAFASEVTDFRTVLQKVDDSDAEVIANLANSAAAAGFIVKQSTELGIDLPFYGTDVFSGSEYLEIAGDAAEGTFLVMTAADTTDEDVVAFLDAYEVKHGEKAPAEAYALFGEDRLNILMQAIEAVGYDGPAIRDYLYEMEAYDGLSGSVEFDENGDSSVMPTLNVYGEDGTYSVVK